MWRSSWNNPCFIAHHEQKEILFEIKQLNEKWNEKLTSKCGPYCVGQSSKLCVSLVAFSVQPRPCWNTMFICFTMRMLWGKSNTAEWSTKCEAKMFFCLNKGDHHETQCLFTEQGLGARGTFCNLGQIHLKFETKTFCGVGQVLFRIWDKYKDVYLNMVTNLRLPVCLLNSGRVQEEAIDTSDGHPTTKQTIQANTFTQTSFKCPLSVSCDIVTLQWAEWKAKHWLDLLCHIKKCLLLTISTFEHNPCGFG